MDILIKEATTTDSFSIPTMKVLPLKSFSLNGIRIITYYMHACMYHIWYGIILLVPHTLLKFVACI